MKKPLKKLLLAIVLLLTGAAILEMVLTDPEFETGVRIFSAVCAIPFMILALFLGKGAIAEFRALKKKASGKNASEILKNEIAATLLPDFSTAGDEDDPQRRLSAFRRNYGLYFTGGRGPEKAIIQRKVTQIYHNILELHRRRLESKGVNLSFTSERKCYGDYPVHTASAFDGKYEIQDIREDIAAKSVYTKDGKEIFSRTSAEIAHYTVINAKQVGGDRIICPNCGVETDRTELLDGCDYCGTKFTVEDLGERISDFSLCRNLEVEYEKFRAYRNKLNLWVGSLVAIIIAIPCIYWTAKSVLSTPEVAESGLIMKVFTALFTVAFPAAAAAFLAVLLFDVTLLPVLHASASTAYIAKKHKEDKKAAQKQALDIPGRIRSFDPLFSLANFSSGLVNKLAAVIFAESEKESGAFYVGEKPLDSGRYRNIIDFDALELELVDYKVEARMQHLAVDAVLNLVEFDGVKCSSRLEKVRLFLQKSADCKTQAVCAPTIMTCKGCGSSRSLLDGKECPYCGTELVFSDYDWVISQIQYQ